MWFVLKQSEKYMRFISITLAVLLAACAIPTDNTYQLTKTIALPGDGGWDYLNVDAAARKVYISHNTEVNILDADSGKLIGKIDGTNGVHGIALAPDLGHGFTSNGKANNITIFDLKTLKILSQAKTGNKPDAIIYDPATQRVFAFNGNSASATVINAITGKHIADIDLGGQPEYAATNRTGDIFVNLEDKNELLKIDAHKLKILARWPLALGESPSSLAIDIQNHRLFVGCRNKLLLVVNSDNGKVVDTLPLGEGVDATAFDPETNLVISSNGEGTLTIIHQDTLDDYHVADIIKTRKGSRTFALDTKTHRLFIPTADFGLTPLPTPGNPKPRPLIIPDSFNVLIYDK